jgi:hypothetical protein
MATGRNDPLTPPPARRPLAQLSVTAPDARGAPKVGIYRNEHNVMQCVTLSGLGTTEPAHGAFGKREPQTGLRCLGLSFRDHRKHRLLEWPGSRVANQTKETLKGNDGPMTRATPTASVDRGLGFYGDDIPVALRNKP